MALVSTGYRLTVSLIDTSASVSTLTFALTSADALTAATDAAAILAALANVSASAVQSYTIAEVFEENALALPADAQNAEKASLTLQLAGSSKKANLRIPAPLDGAPPTGIFNSATGAGANQVATSAAAVEAYVGLFVAGAEATISDGESVAPIANGSIIAGKRITVRSSNP